MPPPTIDPDNPYDTGPWLHRPASVARVSKYAALVTIGACALAWALFGAWACWANPERLGPARLITALALVVATATACAVAWLACMGELIWTTLTRLLMELATRNLIATVTRTTTTGPAPATTGHRLGLVEQQRR